jgi:AcrR family transcriptional regulator
MREKTVKQSGSGRMGSGGTRNKILDAAEHLFTHRGYNGTSVRDVTVRAGASLGVFGHHVGSKEELFRQVIERRSARHVAEVLACLETIDGAGVSNIGAIIRAYFATSTEWFMRGDEGHRNYVMLVARSMSLPYYDSFLEPLGRIYDPVVTRLYTLVQKTYPDAAAERLHWAIYFLQAIYIHLVTQSRIVDRQSGGLCHSADLDEALDELTPFLVAAFNARLTSEE